MDPLLSTVLDANGINLASNAMHRSPEARGGFNLH